MKIEPATADDVRSVAKRMRERDRAEFSAVSWLDDHDALVEDLATRYGGRPDVMCGFRGDDPVCIGGVIEARPNVLSLLFFATDEFPRVAFSVTRFICGDLFARLKAAGVHRIEAVSMVGHDETHKWLRTLGLEAETPPMRSYGKGGEAFIQFAWTR